MYGLALSGLLSFFYTIGSMEAYLQPPQFSGPRDESYDSYSFRRYASRGLDEAWLFLLSTLFFSALVLWCYHRCARHRGWNRAIHSIDAFCLCTRNIRWIDMGKAGPLVGPPTLQLRCGTYSRKKSANRHEAATAATSPTATSTTATTTWTWNNCKPRKKPKTCGKGARVGAGKVPASSTDGVL